MLTQSPFPSIPSLPSPQPDLLFTVINPQLCIPYFTVHISLYDGDTYSRVVDRIRRISGIPGTIHMHTHYTHTHVYSLVRTCAHTHTHTHNTGNLHVQLCRYLKDARSIPVCGDSNDQIDIGTQSTFTIADGTIHLFDPDNGSDLIPIGTHVQYVVDK